MKCDEQIVTMIRKEAIFTLCGHELIVTEGNGINQYYDTIIECSKKEGGCGFSKKAGNEKWLVAHCEHCGQELTKAEKERNNTNLSIATKRGFGKISRRMTCLNCKRSGLISENFVFRHRAQNRNWWQRLCNKERRKGL